ncbi:MAG: alanine--tRNA ligase-related protein, partial [Thermoplasmata archaeon]
MDEKELALDFFRNNGFIRKQCTSCGKHFWTRDTAREKCGDNPCEEYNFIGNPITKSSMTPDEVRQTFISFFEKKAHTRIDRYPVVARWRNDIYLTNASIADFQPHVTGGISPPPANPLVISQPSIRLIDIDSVGKSGRHLTNFEMMAHHAFNDENTNIYWKEECVAYCDEFLRRAVGVKPESISYKENPWSGGGNAGPAFEVLVSGIELATLVFMDLKYDPNGPYIVKGERYSKMPRRIVDTGYGLERFVWASTGSPTVYDAVFPDIVRKLIEEAGIEHTLEDKEYRHILSEHA